MAHKKNKTEILDRIITEDGLSEYFDWEYSDYDHYDCYYYDYDYYCGCSTCSPEYEYLPKEQDSKTYIQKRRNIRSKIQIEIGRMVDMNSINYSKDILRQRRIDYILGIEDGGKKLTLGDFWNFGR